MGYYLGDCNGNCYGRGDYYRGDYYRGDPGIFGSIAKVLGRVVGGVAKNLPVVRAISTAVDLFKPRPSAPMLPAVAPQLPQVPFGFGQAPSFPAPGTQVLQARMAGGYVCAPDGKRGHLNKSTYVTRGGGTSRWPQFLQIHPKGSECVGPRRMNVANPRALRRALRRASGFAKLASRYVKVSRRFKSGKKRKR